MCNRTAAPLYVSVCVCVCENIQDVYGRVWGCVLWIFRTRCPKAALPRESQWPAVIFWPNTDCPVALEHSIKNLLKMSLWFGQFAWEGESVPLWILNQTPSLKPIVPVCICEVDQGCGVQREQTAINLVEKIPTIFNQEEGSVSRKNFPLVCLAVLFSHSSFVWCTHERDNGEMECVKEGGEEKKREGVCVCMRERFIIRIMSPSGTIWDSSLPLWSSQAFRERTLFQLRARGRRAAPRPR